ncbi:stage II sporulation protein R [Bacillus salacetis]|uniref:Stage II sporulation protein R n=1 Tax=Bacillus salacetis TaxID=2315464 RepID=A0A3A1R266_9BACI|nr:stage II sporulation protein R [Bacillus salacetis]RIW36144.1 stage II sporulation protein R [Bacillus salacetis]
MKSTKLAWMYIITLCMGTILSLYIPKQESISAQQEVQVIPNEAIRLRILADSDKEEDQAVKRLIRDRVNEEITVWVEQLTSLEEARTTIKAGLPELQEIAEDVMEEEGLSQTVNVEFGKVDFPTKLYGQFLYPAGEYEAILITLGSGQGANWWCVLYPPLCFLDFSSGTAVRSPGFETTAEASEVDEVSAETAVSEEEAIPGVKEIPEEEHAPVSEAPETPETDEVSEQLGSGQVVDSVKTEPADAQDDQLFVKEEESEVEVRFFVVDFIKKLIP